MKAQHISGFSTGNGDMMGRVFLGLVLLSALGATGAAHAQKVAGISLSLENIDSDTWHGKHQDVEQVVSLRYYPDPDFTVEGGFGYSLSSVAAVVTGTAPAVAFHETTGSFHLAAGPDIRFSNGASLEFLLGARLVEIPDKANCVGYPAGSVPAFSCNYAFSPYIGAYGSVGLYTDWPFSRGHRRLFVRASHVALPAGFGTNGLELGMLY